MAKTLVFKNYTEEEIEKLLSTPVSEKIVLVKVNRWLGTKDIEYYYGLDAYDKNGNWFGMCEGKRAVIFGDRKTASRVCKKINEQINRKS